MPELALAQWALLVGVTFAAGLVQASTGFGFAVISVPFFLIALDSLAAIQVNIVLNLVISMALVPRIWRRAPPGLMRGLIGGTLLGLPVGMVAYLHADLAQVKVAIAVVIVAFALRLMFGTGGDDKRPAPPRSPAHWGIGTLSGTMSAALAMPGPSVLIYLGHYRMEKDTFRATTLTLYLVSYASALALQATVGGMSAGSWLLAAVLVPIAIVGGVAGHRLSPHISQRAFRTTVLGTLMITGLYMLATTLL